MHKEGGGNAAQKINMRLSSVRLSSRQSVAELCSAFCSAAGQDLAAVRGGHSLAEAVLFLALTLLRLIGKKHDEVSFL